MSDRPDPRDPLSALLGQHAIEHDPGDAFDRKVVGAWRLQRSARTFEFWRPAIIGAILASVALVAVVQVLTAKPKPPVLKGQEARLSAPQIPSYTETERPIDR